MVMNLQYFGGRGSSSGIGNDSSAKQITVNADGTRLIYRRESDGNVYSVVVSDGTLWEGLTAL